MSANKSADSVPEPSQIVVGDGKKKMNPVLKSRLKLGSIALGVVLVAVFGFLVFQKLTGSGKDDAEKTQSSKVPPSAQKMTEVNGKPITETQRSQQAIYYGDYDKGQQILEDQIGSAKTADEKINLYRQLATNALNAKKYDEAEAYVQKALQIKKTAGLYSLLATIAAAQGNKAKAIEYANQQKQLLDPKASAYTRQIEDIDQFIEGQK